MSLDRYWQNTQHGSEFSDLITITHIFYTFCYFLQNFCILCRISDITKCSLYFVMITVSSVFNFLISGPIDESLAKHKRLKQIRKLYDTLSPNGNELNMFSMLLLNNNTVF